MNTRVFTFQTGGGVRMRSGVLLFLLAFALRVIPGFLIPGSQDVWAWRFATYVSDMGMDPYATSYVFNWPPFWLTLVSAMIHAGADGVLPVYGLIKLPPCLADAAITVMIFRMLLKRNAGPGGERQAIMGACLYALNPVSILVTSVHGNFIAVPMAFLVASVQLLDARAARWNIIGSSAALGVGIMSKIWPVVAVPFVLARVRSWRNILLYVPLVVLPTIASLLPLGLKDPQLVIKRFILYDSLVGWWGFTSFSRIWTAPWAQAVSSFYERWGTVVLGLALLLLLVRTWKMELCRALCLLFLTVLFFLTGFGVQYVFLAIPFAILSSDRWVTPYTVLATVLLSLEYGFIPLPGFCGIAVFQETPLLLTWTQYTHDNRITDILRLPVWLFVGAWLIRSLLPATSSKSAIHGPLHTPECSRPETDRL